MKISLNSIVFGSFVASVAASDSKVTSFEKLNVQVTCQGIDYDALSLRALSFSAKALEDSFNGVHKNADGVTLQHVASTVPLKSTLLRGKNNISFSANIPLKAGDLGGDDFKCRLCGSDTAAADLLDATKLKGWEEDFVTAITTSSFDVYAGAKSCSIKMTSPDDASLTTVETETPVPVEVDVKCENINFAEMPIRALSYATKALKSAYDSVHNAVDGSHLGNAILSGHRLRLGDLGGDDFKCRLCGSEDEMETFGTVTFHANAFFTRDLGGDDFKCRLCNDIEDSSDKEMLKAWEGLFLSHMLKDPIGSFKQANHCTILMKEQSKSNEMAEVA